jgi:hypothetical protein
MGWMNGFDSWQGWGISSSPPRAGRLLPAQHPSKTGSSFFGVRRLERQGYLSIPCTTGAQNACSFTFKPPCLRGVVLKHGDNCNFLPFQSWVTDTRHAQPRLSEKKVYRKEKHNK